MPRWRLPLIVDGPQARPVGPCTPSWLSERAIARSDSPAVLEDATDDGGLRAVDLSVAADHLTVGAEGMHDLIAIRIAAAGLAGFDLAAEAAPGLVGKVL